MDKIIFGPETIISQASADVSGWGRWQFPRGWAGRGGALFAEFDDSDDSAAGYTKPKMLFRSDDDGATWRETSEKGGLLLPGGDLIRPLIPPPVPVGSLTYPRCIGERKTYALTLKLYLAAEMPSRVNSWHLERLPAGSDQWRSEQISIDFPDLVMYTEGTVVQPNMFWDLKLAPDGTVWGIYYGFVMQGGEASFYSCCVFFRSSDGGRSWEKMSAVTYDPALIEAHDPRARERDGFTEPDIGFAGGQMYCIMRTMDGLGQAPSYIVYSTDGGRSWGRPRLFDTFGVWPQNLNLADGSVIQSYGRPSVSLRLLRNGVWSEGQRVPGLRDSCSYSDLIPLAEGDGNDALLIYSDFSYPGPDGSKRKTILCRKVRPAEISDAAVSVASESEKEAVFAIRRQVFVVGQNIDQSLEYDQYDEPGSAAVHFLLRHKGVPAGAARMIEYHDGYAKLQRVAVLEEYRKLGLGRVLVTFAERYADAAGYKGIVLDAQCAVRGFYESLGYTAPTGEIFPDAGIPHVRMKKEFD